MKEKRLHWACRRGMLELDLILLPFMQRVFPELSPHEQDGFARLLDCEDQDLYAWLMRREVSQDEAIQQTVDLVLRHTGPAAAG